MLLLRNPCLHIWVGVAAVSGQPLIAVLDMGIGHKALFQVCLSKCVNHALSIITVASHFLF